MKETHEYASRGTSSFIPVDSCLRCGKSKEAHLEELKITPEERAKEWLIKHKIDYINHPFLLTILTSYIDDPST